ncbi:MAG TPA: choice-of-anchor tandem repeat GloVer-containing protein [Rhizomicrobium sp.]|jgi:uncharacterized repeat protein (TIGR03803 family)
MLTNIRANRKRVRLLVLSAAMAPLISLNIAHAEKKERLLYSFCSQESCTDGSTPGSGVIRAADGTLYGTTEGGGQNSVGTIYKITPDGQETLLYSFDPTTGEYPADAPALDGKGNLYGVTVDNMDGYEGGVVYKLAPDGTYTVLHYSHQDPAGGGMNGVTLDKKGNLYGVSYQGGKHGDGVVWKVTPAGRYKVLYNFAGSDGAFPTGIPLLDNDGNLFGTTQQGGQYGSGTIYELTPDGTETVLYSFSGPVDGGSPLPGLVRDDNGNFYGTTQQGGANKYYGTLFKFAPSGTLTVLHAFAGPDAGDGDYCNSSPTIVKKRNGENELFGVCSFGGAGDAGIAYKFSASGKYKVIYNFTDYQNGPYVPKGLLAGNGGKLYGTSDQGGGTGCAGTGCGTVFELY